MTFRLRRMKSCFSTGNPEAEHATADIERETEQSENRQKFHSIVKAHVRGEMYVHQTSDYDADEFQEVINDAQDDGYSGVIFKDVSDGMGANSGQQSQVVVVFDPKDVLIQDESHAGNPVLFSRFGDGVLDAAVPKVNSIAKSVGEVFRSISLPVVACHKAHSVGTCSARGTLSLRKTVLPSA